MVVRISVLVAIVATFVQYVMEMGLFAIVERDLGVSNMVLLSYLSFFLSLNSSVLLLFIRSPLHLESCVDTNPLLTPTDSSPSTNSNSPTNIILIVVIAGGGSLILGAIIVALIIVGRRSRRESRHEKVETFNSGNSHTYEGLGLELQENPPRSNSHHYEDLPSPRNTGPPSSKYLILE